MVDAFLVVIIFVLFFVSLALQLRAEFEAKTKVLPACFWLLWVSFIAWFVVSAYQPVLKEFTEIRTVIEIPGPNGPVQGFTYLNTSNEIILFNANTYFKSSVKPGTKIEHVRYSPGPYCGIYYSSSVRDKFKLIKD